MASFGSDLVSGTPHLRLNVTPLWNDLPPDEWSRLFRDCYNRYLSCNARGNIMSLCRCGFLNGGGPFNSELACIPGHQLWRNWPSRIHTQRMKVATSGPKKTNLHARGGRSRGDGRSSPKAAAPPFSPPISTTALPQSGLTQPSPADPSLHS